jgi:hypothetical protein
LGSDTPNGDGCGSASRRRRRKYQTIDAIKRATPAIAPTTTPAILPACDLCGFELGLEDAVDDGWVVEDAVGVASGES